MKDTYNINYFIDTINEVLKEPQVHKMDNFFHHGNITTLSHCISVAYYSYIMAINCPFKVNVRSVIIGAMLHDFYLYDWHDKNKEINWHGFRHPKIALTNAQKYFNLNEIEKDIILRHMWPLTIIPPKYLESFIVSAADKTVTVMETFKLFNKKFLMVNKRLALINSIDIT
ncbi:MAG TPA: HD domain-containing protein [Clostridia bacterium]